MCIGLFMRLWLSRPSGEPHRANMNSFSAHLATDGLQERLLSSASFVAGRGLLTRCLLPATALLLLASSLQANTVSGTVFVTQGQSRRPAVGVRVVATALDGNVFDMLRPIPQDAITSAAFLP